jgi:hypothetical protein
MRKTQAGCGRGPGGGRICTGQRRGTLAAWVLLSGQVLLSGLVWVSAPARAATFDASTGISVPGPGARPEIAFACCDQGIGPMQALFADPGVIPELKSLDARVGVAIEDFSPERAQIVRRLNQEGVPAIAWLLLAKEDGYYLNADNATAAAARVTAFEQWTQENHLQWAAVGLDIEPDFAELKGLSGYRWRLTATLLEQALEFRRMARAQQDYVALIRKLQADGYAVQTYQMPYVLAERREGSELADRMLGTVDVQGNEEYVMLYSSFARPAGAGMIWFLGPDAQGIALGSTDGDGTAGSGRGPLSWDEFARDLTVAGHYSRRIAVYDLEGCVRQGYLARLNAMDWSAPAVIPSASISRVVRLGFLVRGLFWVTAHFVVIVCCAILVIAAVARQRRIRRWMTSSVMAIRLRN